MQDLSPRRKNPLKGLRRAFLQLFIIGLLFYVAYLLVNSYWAYLQVRHLIPEGTVVAGVEVGGLDRENARQALEMRYLSPVIAVYNGQGIEIDPNDLGFSIEIEAMLDQVFDQMNEISQFNGFVNYVVESYFYAVPLERDNTIEIDLIAAHDPSSTNYVVSILANLIDRPATLPSLLIESGEGIKPGNAGFFLNQEDSIPQIEAALYQPENRTVDLSVEVEDAPQLDLTYLQRYIEQQLATFDGVGSIYILDLNSGEEININSGGAISGLSVVKIAIMLEALRTIDGQINFDQQKLMEETAIYSGNYSANLLLDVVAETDNAYLGVDILTRSMQNLGLVNTFIVTPYEERPRAGKESLRTPANSQGGLSFDPDPAMQTTSAEIGRLLGMIYECADGRGTLIAVYPNEITPNECQYLIDLMVQNDEGNLIRFGVPESTNVAHKHGWAYNTHGDAGIVFTEGGDYVIAQFLYQDSDWLPTSVSFPLLREISRAVYNFYNPETPYVDHKRAQRVAGQYAAEQAKFAIEQGISTTQ
ncbi:MAG: serine hydrolase [Chloroflexota bacterium]